jgi:membrane-bound inhibitor of C-type lysozyme
VALLVGALLAAPESPATADGPDFHDARNVPVGEALVLRAAPRADAEAVAELPADATCMRNLGCEGGLTLEEFTTLPETERLAIERARPRWCRVEAGGVQGWAPGRQLGEAAGPCDALAAQLAALDAELRRLEALVASGPEGAAARRARRAWLAARIAALRAESEPARADALGISAGPIAYRCAGSDAPLVATFLATDPALVHLRDGDATWLFEQAPAASGAKYQGPGGEAEVFWSKGEEATFQADADAPALACRAEGAAPADREARP